MTTDAVLLHDLTALQQKECLMAPDLANAYAVMTARELLERHGWYCTKLDPSDFAQIAMGDEYLHAAWILRPMTPKECVGLYAKMMHTTGEAYDVVAERLLHLMTEHYNLNDPKNQ
jgi:hypothetical protein